MTDPTNPTVSAGALIPVVRLIAAMHPDHTYRRPSSNTCHNLADSTGHGLGHGCLIGLSLQALGVPLTVLDNGRSIAAFLHIDGMHTKEHKWLGCVQSCQDTELSWGQAVSRADKTFPLLTTPSNPTE